MARDSAGMEVSLLVPTGRGSVKGRGLPSAVEDLFASGHRSHEDVGCVAGELGEIGDLGISALQGFLKPRRVVNVTESQWMRHLRRQNNLNDD